MRVIGFTLSGKYALFTKPFTKNQPQSFVIPPKTAIIGMIGAIFGFSRDEYQKKLSSLKYSVVLKNDITKYTTRFNLLQGKSATFNYSKNPLRNPPERGQRSPTTFELLKNPAWDIFISLDDDLLIELEFRIKKSLFEYEPYLGIANAFAKLELFQEMVELERGLDKINSFFEYELAQVKLTTPSKFYNELIPVTFESGRTKPQTKKMVIFNNAVEIINKKEVEDAFYRYKEYSIRFI